MISLKGLGLRNSSPPCANPNQSVDPSVASRFSANPQTQRKNFNRRHTHLRHSARISIDDIYKELASGRCPVSTRSQTVIAGPAHEFPVGLQGAPQRVSRNRRDEVENSLNLVGYSRSLLHCKVQSGPAARQARHKAPWMMRAGCEQFLYHPATITQYQSQLHANYPHGNCNAATLAASRRKTDLFSDYISPFFR